MACMVCGKDRRIWVRLKGQGVCTGYKCVKWFFEQEFAPEEIEIIGWFASQATFIDVKAFNRSQSARKGAKTRKDRYGEESFKGYGTKLQDGFNMTKYR